MKKLLTENQRHTWSAIVLSVGLFLLPVSPSLLAVTVYIRFVVDEELELVQGMNTATLPYFLASTGTLNFMCNLFLLSAMARTHRPSSRVNALKPLVIAIFINVAGTFLVFCACIFCFIQMATLPSSFKAGLKEAMEKYSTVPHIKVRMDLLQMEYQCCGDSGYKDWFNVPWVPQAILVADLKEVQRHLSESSQYINDDVPFSCCDPNSPRPCIHHHVVTDHLHYNYDHRLNTTLYTAGCRTTLMNYFGHRLLKNVGLCLLFLFFIQLAMLFAARLLQTSMQNAISQGDILAPAIGYLLLPPPSEPFKTDLEAATPLLAEEAESSVPTDTTDTEGGEMTSEEPSTEPSEGDTDTVDLDSTPDEEAIYENVTPESLYDDIGPPPPHPPPPPPLPPDTPSETPATEDTPSVVGSEPLFPSEMAELANEKDEGNHNMSYRNERCYPPPLAPRHRLWRNSTRDSRAFSSLGITRPSRRPRT